VSEKTTTATPSGRRRNRRLRILLYCALGLLAGQVAVLLLLKGDGDAPDAPGTNTEVAQATPPTEKTTPSASRTPTASVADAAPSEPAPNTGTAATAPPDAALSGAVATSEQATPTPPANETFRDKKARLAAQRAEEERRRRAAEDERRRTDEERRKRLDEERRLAEAQRMAQERRRLEEEQRRDEDEQRRRAEEQRLQDERRRLEEERRKAEEARLAEERRRLQEEKRRLEEEREKGLNKEPSEALVIVINSRAGTGSVSSAQLRDIYMGQTRSWPNGVAVRPFNRPTNTGAGKKFFSRVVSYAKFKQFWDSAPSAMSGQRPPAIPDANVLVSRVASTAGAVGYVLESELPSDTRGLKLVKF
jgi:hypothetical protein